MPIYTIKCTKCGHEEDIIKSMSEDFPKCSKCNGKVERVFQPTNSIWKCDGACGKKVTK